MKPLKFSFAYWVDLTGGVKPSLSGFAYWVEMG
jgi:hypothetical protein